jgi:tetratricopeptide (TPR) repeat protein
MKKHPHEKADVFPQLANSWSWTKKISLFLIAAIFAIYSQTLDHEFINYDDDVYVTKNNFVQEGFTNNSIVWAFTTNHSANWHPVTWLSHMLDYELYGLNPGGHHFTSVLMHAGNALLLFIVLLRMTGALWQSAFVAALFALHPLNVDSVAWVAERKNVLSTSFWLATMWAYVSYVETKSYYKYILALLFFALGLMSKPMLVTLPFVLLMLDYWPLNRLRPRSEKGPGISVPVSRLIIEKIPFLGLVIASSIVTFLAQKDGGAVQSDMFSPKVRILNALVSYVEYLHKMFLPIDLSILYPHPGGLLPVWKGVVCAAVLIGISVAAVKLIRRAPYFVFGWFWYLGTLVPVIGLVQVGVQSMADRYAYIPLIGIFIVIAWGTSDLTAKMGSRTKVIAYSAGGVIISLMVTSLIQISHWKDSVTILQHAVNAVDKEYSSFANIYNNLGRALNEQKKVEQAQFNFLKALRLNPEHAFAHNNLGATFIEQNRFTEAIPHFRAALKTHPDDAESHNHLGVALSRLRQPEEAIIHYKQAINLNPNFLLAYNHLGMTLSEMGKFTEAESSYRKAIALNPNYAEAHNNLGTALGNMKKFDEAIAHYKEAIRIKPDYTLAHQNLNIALSLKRKTNIAPDIF